MKLGAVTFLKFIFKKVTLRSYNFFCKFTYFGFLENLMISVAISKAAYFYQQNARINMILHVGM
jgi:hypothetical protein